ncbi:exported hypothetical protein [Phycicoccus elongatus Lp2]|uniref:Uncharacterized protein n=1 Tax=Phycicoccus elongatus Lp2 TaxID=1193181 RepID=N0E038_9MICO|nr:exported hypothetical protein [Phycicoccus elongatus Lp2]
MRASSGNRHDPRAADIGGKPMKSHRHHSLALVAATSLVALPTAAFADGVTPASVTQSVNPARPSMSPRRWPRRPSRPSRTSCCSSTAPTA